MSILSSDAEETSILLEDDIEDESSFDDDDARDPAFEPAADDVDSADSNPPVDCLPPTQRRKRVDVDLTYALKKSADAHVLQSVAVQHHNKRLNERLAANQMQRVPIYRDGDCFFNAALQHVTAFSDAAQLRNALCTHMLENVDTYTPFVDSDDNFLGLLASLRQDGTWSSKANDLLPLALANATGRRVKIFCSRRQQPHIDIQPTLTQADIFNPIYLGLLAVPGLEHYDGVIAEKQHLYQQNAPVSHHQPDQTKDADQNYQENEQREYASPSTPRQTEGIDEENTSCFPETSEHISLNTEDSECSAPSTPQPTATSI